MPRTTRWALIAVFLFASGCRHEDAKRPAASSAPSEADTRAAEEAADRAELVLPAPYFWRPETPGMKLKLELSLEKTALRAGETIRYRLELKNVGDKDVFFYEDSSFMKLGVDHTEFHAYLTAPGRGERALPPPFVLGARRPTVAEVSQAGRTDLRATLHTGETLVTRADPPGSRFRTLRTLTVLREPGRHKIRFIYERAGNAALNAESNPVFFDVVP